MGEMTTAMQPKTGNNAVSKLQMWHCMIVDWKLQNPGQKWEACAEFFSVTHPWLSRILNSDLFKLYYAERLKAHQEMVSAEVVAAAQGTALRGLALIEHRMQRDAATMPMDDVRENTKLALESLGFGHKHAPAGPGQTPVQINIGAIDAESLAAAREKMRVMHSRNSEELNGEADALTASSPRLADDASDAEVVDMAARLAPPTEEELPDPDTTLEAAGRTGHGNSLPPQPAVETEEDGHASQVEEDLLQQIFDETA